jgi:hypothetical protein
MHSLQNLSSTHTRPAGGAEAVAAGEEARCTALHPAMDGSARRPEQQPQQQQNLSRIHTRPAGGAEAVAAGEEARCTVLHPAMDGSVPADQSSNLNSSNGHTANNGTDQLNIRNVTLVSPAWV